MGLSVPWKDPSCQTSTSLVFVFGSATKDYLFPWLPSGIPSALASPFTRVYPHFAWTSKVVFVAISVRNTYDPCFGFAPAVLMAMSHFGSPFASDQVPFVIGPMFFGIRGTMSLSVSVSIYGRTTALLVGGSPYYRGEVFLFSGSAPGRRVPFIGTDFEHGSASSVHRWASMLQSSGVGLTYSGSA